MSLYLGEEEIYQENKMKSHSDKINVDNKLASTVHTAISTISNWYQLDFEVLF